MIVGSAQLNSVTSLVKHRRAQPKERIFFSKKDLQKHFWISVCIFFSHFEGTKGDKNLIQGSLGTPQIERFLHTQGTVRLRKPY